MKNYFFTAAIILLLFFKTDLINAQSSVVIGDGASIDLGAGTDLMAGSVTGTVTGSGTINGGPLPVELVSFTANTINTGTRSCVFLKWQTATEVNNYGFEIEKLKDSKIERLKESKQEWETITFIKGHGNSNVKREYEYADENLSPGNYIYRLKQIDNDGTFTYSDLAEVSFMKPEKFVLEQNYPNPFNPTTNFVFRISNFGFVSLKLYDILGNEVTTLVNENKEPGGYEVEYNASLLSSGLYVYKLESAGQVQVKKMVLLK